MKTNEQELNELILSYSVKSEHEVSKAIKAFADKTVALNKDLGESEAAMQKLDRAFFNARNDREAQTDLEAQITSLEARQKAITDEIDYIRTATSRLSEINIGKQIEKLLKKHKKYSVKAVEEMIKHSI